jgi:hypothetical protein
LGLGQKFLGFQFWELNGLELFTKTFGLLLFTKISTRDPVVPYPFPQPRRPALSLTLLHSQTLDRRSWSLPPTAASLPPSHIRRIDRRPSVLDLLPLCPDLGPPSRVSRWQNATVTTSTAAASTAVATTTLTHRVRAASTLAVASMMRAPGISWRPHTGALAARVASSPTHQVRPASTPPRLGLESLHLNGGSEWP